MLDQHPYLAFGDPNTETHASRTSVACNWAGGTNDTMNSWGVVVGGEWSNAVNKYVSFLPFRSPFHAAGCSRLFLQGPCLKTRPSYKQLNTCLTR